MSSTVAIIMRARNEMPHIQRALAALQRQSFRSFDLFAVDSGSTDGSLEALRGACAEGWLVEIAPRDYVPGKVLNEAIARTGHDLIVLLNADAVPLTDDWLDKLVGALLRNEADMTFSRQVAREDARFIVAYDYRRAYDPRKTAPGFFSAVACAFRRELWEQRKFREEGYAEDAIWAEECLAEGCRIRLVQDSAVEHSHNYTLAELREKRRRQAKALAECGMAGKSPAALYYRCCREIIRDFLHACLKLKMTTIPYNLAYRVAACSGQLRGIREGVR